MEDLYTYLADSSRNSDFKAELSVRGGYIAFSNSGRRGPVKYFHIGLDSLIQTLSDILEHFDVFSKMTEYDESDWRNNGSEFFQDPVANANPTVQTKPLFSTLSKVIMWGNSPALDNNDPDKTMVITIESLQKAITKLNEIADSFVPQNLGFKKVTPPLDEPHQIIFYGAPGTGKSFTIDCKTNPERTIRTTFHPDSDYASFVGTYKPTMADAKINSIYGDSVQFATGKNGHPGTEKKIVYKYVPQAFLKAYVAAWSNLNEPYFLVIEEINRGNCAQIFGDLFQLLDRNNMGCSSYSISADEDLTQFLSSDLKGFAGLSEESKKAISEFVLVKDDGKTLNIGEDILNGSKLLLPPNLYIWATMNTSDQSLFPIDSAFKRRWNWKYMPIEYNKENWTFIVGGNRYKWGEFLQKINPIISELTQSPDKQLGYYFAKPDEKSDDTQTKNDTISENIFLNKVIFYLWTDVLKDFDAGSEPFINADTQRTYEFSEFFDSKKDYLAQFISKPEFGLTIVSDDEVTDTESDGTRVKYGKFLANGLKSDTITWCVYILLRDYAKANSFNTIETLVSSCFERDDAVIKMVENAQEYKKENGWLKELITTQDGISFAVTNQWKKKFIPMVQKLAEAVGGTFEQVHE